MAAVDAFDSSSEGMDSPADNCATVTPHDSNELTYITRGVYVGGSGDIAVTTKNDEDVTFTAVPAGTVLPVRVKLIKSTGTTATNMVAMW